MKILVAWLIILGLLFITGLASALELGEADNGRNVLLKRGETLTVTLPGNPTTGFQWEVVAVDPAILSSQGASTFIPESHLTGAGGKCAFRFKPLKVGSTWLKMAYRRLWEKNVPPVGRFEVSITIVDGGEDEGSTDMINEGMTMTLKM